MVRRNKSKESTTRYKPLTNQNTSTKHFIWSHKYKIIVILFLVIYFSLHLEVLGLPSLIFRMNETQSGDIFEGGPYLISTMTNDLYAGVFENCLKSIVDSLQKANLKVDFMIVCGPKDEQIQEIIGKYQNYFENIHFEMAGKEEAKYSNAELVAIHKSEEVDKIIGMKRNRIMEYAKGKYNWVIQIDSDMVLQNDTISRLIQAKKKFVGVCYANRWSRNGLIYVLPFYPKITLINILAIISEMFFKGNIKDAQTACKDNSKFHGESEVMIAGPSGSGVMMIHRSLFDLKFEFYDLFGLYGEDVGFILNLIREKRIWPHVLTRVEIEHNWKKTISKEREKERKLSWNGLFEFF